MSYYLDVIKDAPIGLWKLDESSGSVAYDYSGCGNHASYVGQISRLGMPVVSGGNHSNRIDNSNYIQFPISKDFSGTTGTGGFATPDTYDNDFSIEVWMHPKTLVSLTPILADSAGIGLYWDNGNIVFKLESERIDYSVQNPSRVMHVVGVYSVRSMSLYLDGVLVASKNISIRFTNASVTLSSGPTAIGEYFLIDSPAIYRYALSSEAISSHYKHLFLNKDEQIAVADLGQLLVVSEKYHNPETQYFYPERESWTSLIYDNNNLSYNSNDTSVYLSSGNYGEIIKDLGLSILKPYVSSKIDWVASTGVSVYVSTVSAAGPWSICTNGSSIPGFTQGSSFSTEEFMYFKIAFSSSNLNFYIPELYSLKISFYTEKKTYAKNGGNTISVSQPTSGTTWDVDLSTDSYPVRSRNYNNGVRPKSSAFLVNLAEPVKSIEMIFTPKSLSSGHLMFNKTGLVETYLSWAAGGAISKSNISSIYINGQDVSSATNISSYLYIDEPNYIFIKATSLISGELFLNGKQILGVRSGVLDDNLYQNIATYSADTISPADHYSLYIGKPSAIGEDSSISLTEKSVSTYSRDRVVFQIV
jgi:hypothetical protein